MRKINWTFAVTVTVVYAFMLGAAAISFSHIVDVAGTLGLGWERWTVPFFVDGLALLGKVGRSRRFSGSARSAGLKLMIGTGGLSLACNIYAGDNLGQQLYGALVVCGFITAEWYSIKLEPAPVVVPVEVDDETRAKRSEAARKAAVTRKANAAKKAATAPRQRARRGALQVQPVAA